MVKDQLLTFRVDLRTKRALEALAQERGQTLSELLRLAALEVVTAQRGPDLRPAYIVQRLRRAFPQSARPASATGDERV